MWKSLERIKFNWHLRTKCTLLKIVRLYKTTSYLEVLHEFVNLRIFTSLKCFSCKSAGILMLHKTFVCPNSHEHERLFALFIFIVTLCMRSICHLSFSVFNVFFYIMICILYGGNVHWCSFFFKIMTCAKYYMWKKFKRLPISAAIIGFEM